VNALTIAANDIAPTAKKKDRREGVAVA